MSDMNESYWKGLAVAREFLLKAQDAQIAELKRENEILQRVLRNALNREQALEAKLPRMDKERSVSLTLAGFSQKTEPYVPAGTVVKLETSEWVLRDQPWFRDALELIRRGVQSLREGGVKDARIAVSGGTIHVH